MKRIDFIKSDEYITAFTDIIIVSGESVKKMRADINEHMIKLRNELIEYYETDTPSTVDVEGLKFTCGMQMSGGKQCKQPCESCVESFNNIQNKKSSHNDLVFTTVGMLFGDNLSKQITELWIKGWIKPVGLNAAEAGERMRQPIVPSIDAAKLEAMVSKWEKRRVLTNAKLSKMFKNEFSKEQKEAIEQDVETLDEILSDLRNLK